MSKGLGDIDLVRRRLEHRPELYEQLLHEETSQAVREQLGLSEADAETLKNEYLANTKEPVLTNTPDSVMESAEENARDSFRTAEEFMKQSFDQLQNGSRIMLFMSITIFAIGVVFLAIAAVRAFTHPDQFETTAVIGGIGLVQIVALFYRNPLRDISVSVSNAQQSRIVIMSYMLGVAMVAKSLNGKNTEKEHKDLGELTKLAIMRLERYTERADPTTDESSPTK